MNDVTSEEKDRYENSALRNVEQHESHDIEKRLRIQQLLGDVRSSCPGPLQIAKRMGDRPSSEVN